VTTDVGALRRTARFGDFELDPRSAELRRRDGAVVRLSEQPLRILLALIERPHEVVSRQELRGKLWSDRTVVEFEHSINAAVNRLRHVLGDSAQHPQFIETLARRGYRWMVPVEWLAGPDSPAVTKLPASAGPIGRRVSHYRLLEVLGGGGMGIVYKAEDLQLGRCVALKFLGEEYSCNRRAITRLEAEARSLSALDHPNICTIFDVGEHDGRPFLAMQLLQGQTLRQRIESAQGSAFAPLELCDVAIGILAGLAAAHEKGIVHRDVKPANIFLTARGEVKLLDFGLAKPLCEMDSTAPESESARDSAGEARSTNLTLTGAMMGTAFYMAPELILGGHADARSDLFSFGVVLYEMATGCQPFRGATLRALHDAIIGHTPASVSAVSAPVPRGIDTLIEKAIRKNPDERFQTAQELIAELTELRLELVRSRAGSSRVPRRPARRSPIIGTALIASALLAAASALLHSRSLHAPDPYETRVETEKLTDSGPVENVAISSDGRYLAFTQREVDGVDLWVRRLVDERQTLLVPPSEGAGYRGISFSPAGDAVYFVKWNANEPDSGYLYAVPVGGGPPRLLVNDVDSPVGFAPDGRRFVYTRGVAASNVTEIRVADADGAADRVVATVPDTYPDYLAEPTWSPDGRRITVALLHLHPKPRFALFEVDTLSGTVAELIPST
jgi:serine/threonine protein kinase